MSIYCAIWKSVSAFLSQLFPWVLPIFSYDCMENHTCFDINLINMALWHRVIPFAHHLYHLLVISILMACSHCILFDLKKLGGYVNRHTLPTFLSQTLKRKLYGSSNNLVEELRLDDALFHTTPCAPNLVRSVYRLSFSCCFCCNGNDSPLDCHWSAVNKGAWCRAIFSEKFIFLIKTWKDALSCIKRHRRWCFKKCSGLFWKNGFHHMIII